MELMSPSGNTSWRYVAGMLSSSRAPGADSSQRQCIGYCHHTVAWSCICACQILCDNGSPFPAAGQREYVRGKSWVEDNAGMTIEPFGSQGQ
jgi:hypothetical protein